MCIHFFLTDALYITAFLFKFHIGYNSTLNKTLAGKRDGNSDDGTCFTAAPVGGGSTNRKAARRPAARDRKLSVPVLHHNSATRRLKGEDAGTRACGFLGPRPNIDIPAEAWHRLRPGVSSFIDPYWQRSAPFFCLYWFVQADRFKCPLKRSEGAPTDL